MKFRSERLDILQQEKSGKELSPEEFKLLKLLESTYQPKMDSMMDSAKSFEDERDVLGLKNQRALTLKRKYQEDAERYLTFHWLTGSTPPQSVDKIDFPDEDSVESWVKSL